MRREGMINMGGVMALIIFFLAVLLLGAVRIAPGEVFASLFGGEVSNPYIRTIVLETRLPMAIAALSCGSILSVSGLMMQTVFNNPLAGPSVLGISSGASFGVAVLMLSVSGLGMIANGALQPILNILAALVGGIVIIAILLVFSSVMKSGLTLLIVGIMVSYLCSSGISLLNYFSPADEIRNYLVWGLGSFSGIRLQSAMWLLILSAIVVVPCFLYIKPLNAILLGERYLESVGYSAKRTRSIILLLTGIMVAVSTAFCGPIGFIGLIVPHLCRLLYRTSNHRKLLPASILFGAVVSLFCAFLGVLPSSSFGVLPINVITPIIGVPVILALLVNRKKLPYFS